LEDVVDEIVAVAAPVDDRVERSQRRAGVPDDRSGEEGGREDEGGCGREEAEEEPPPPRP
jgi:hypothetical protein